MVNKIWGFFILTGIITCFFTGKVDLINREILKSGEQSLDMIIKLLPIIALWLGIMNIANKSGLLNKLSKLLYPLLKKIFPEIPKNHESLNYISSNIITNMFGLGNVATPFGLKAMQLLQELNNKKDTATRSMITFLVINTSGVTIIPTTIISVRMMHNSMDPTCIIIPCIIATSLATIAGLIADKILARRWKNK
jgi:spore maturation protein A